MDWRDRATEHSGQAGAIKGRIGAWVSPGAVSWKGRRSFVADTQCIEQLTNEGLDLCRPWRESFGHWQMLPTDKYKSAGYFRSSLRHLDAKFAAIPGGIGLAVRDAEWLPVPTGSQTGSRRYSAARQKRSRSDW